MLINRIQKIRKIFLILLVPSLYVLYGIFTIFKFDESLTIDAYLAASTTEALLKGYGYTGVIALVYPPLYTLLSAVLSLFINVLSSLKIISILSAGGLLVFLPLFSLRIVKSYFPGILVQLILSTNPYFLLISTQAESHMLNAFFITGALYFGITYFSLGNWSYVPKVYLLFIVLGAYTRHASLIFVVPFVILVIMYVNKNRVHLIMTITTSIVTALIPWMTYRYLTTGHFFFNYRWNVLGLSVSQNNISSFSPPEWFYVTFFKYSGPTDFILKHPVLFINNNLINIKKILNIYLYSFDPLGIFSVLSGIGLLIVLFHNYERLEYKFLCFVILLYSLIVTITVVKWVYFLHIVPVLATIGISWIYDKSDSIPVPVDSVSVKKICTVGLIFLILWFLQYKGTMAKQRTFMKEGLRFPKNRKPAVKNYIEDKLTSFRKKIDGGDQKKRVMSLVYLPQIYKSGLIPIVAPVPNKSIREILCYEGFTPNRERLIINHNFPPGKKRLNYVPADFFIMDNHYRWILRERPGDLLKDIRNYLSKVQSWPERYGITLYEIKKEALTCK